MDLGHLLMNWVWNVGQRKKARRTPKFKDLSNRVDGDGITEMESLREIYRG